jgi:phosphoglycolate phosphatase-like HAD superfamily hydrolase
MIRDIIWDFDGTLFDTYPVIVNSFKKALKYYGIDERDENILSYFKITENSAITHFKEFYGLDNSFIKKFSDNKKDLKPEIVKPFPFAVNVCRKIIALGGRNYIITHRGDSTLKYLQHYGILCCFTEVVTKKNGFKRKPDPEAFIYLIDKYKINKGMSMVIGDRECEILGGQSAGIKTCLYNTNDVSLDVAPDFYLNSLKNLLDIVS